MTKQKLLMIAAAFIAVLGMPLCAQDQPLKLTVRTLTLVDGEPPVINVTLENRSHETLQLGLTPYLSLRAVIRPQDVPPNRCQVTANWQPSDSRRNRSTRVLNPGEETDAAIDISIDFPLGLRPGKYRVVARYQDELTVVSEPVTLQVVEPQGVEARKAYGAFQESCLAVMERREDASDKVVRFAREYPDFALRDELLNISRRRAPEENRIAMNELLKSSTRFRASAEEDLARVEAASAAAKRRQNYEQEYKAAVKDPVNAAASRAFHALPTISNPSAFGRYEEFLRTYPDSFFAPDALNRVVVAVEDGIVPSHYAGRDNALRDLYSRLVRDYPKSYFAAETLEKNNYKRITAEKDVAP